MCVRERENLLGVFTRCVAILLDGKVEFLLV